MAYEFRKPETAFALDKSSKKTKRMEDAGHLAFIRKLPSVVSGEYPCEACHIRIGSALHRKKHTGMAQKPDDSWCLPLTAAEHREQHSENELVFWRRHGIDPFTLAARLYDVSGDVAAAERIIREVRAAPRAVGYPGPGWIPTTATAGDTE